MQDGLIFSAIQFCETSPRVVTVCRAIIDKQEIDIVSGCCFVLGKSPCLFRSYLVIPDENGVPFFCLFSFQSKVIINIIVVLKIIIFRNNSFRFVKSVKMPTVIGSFICIY